MYRSSEIPRNKKIKILIEGLLSRYTVNHRLADSLIVCSPQQSRRHPFISPPSPPTIRTPHYGVFSLTWRPGSMQIYWNKRKCLHKKGVQLPEDWFGTPTWLPLHCFGTPIWPPSCENALLRTPQADPPFQAHRYYGHTAVAITPIVRKPHYYDRLSR